MPFYRQDDLDKLHHRGFLPGDYPYVRGARVADNTWLVRQDIIVSDYQAANAKALDILMRGVTSLGFVIEDPQSISFENISQLLSGIHLESVELNFMTAGMARELLKAIESALLAVRADMKKVRLSIAANPLGRYAENGKLCIPVDQGLDYLAELVREAEMIPGIKCVGRI